MLKKKVYVILIMITIILGIHLEALAFEIVPEIDQESLKEKKIKISLQVDDLEDYENGINAVSGKLIYDSNIFENVSFTGSNKWTCVYNNEEGNKEKGKFMLITTSGNVTRKREIAEIELQLKPGVTEQNTEIVIEKIQTSHNSEKITAEDKVIQLHVGENGIQMGVVNSNIDSPENQDNIDYIKYIIIVLLTIMIIVFTIIIIKIKRKEKTNEK